MGIMTMRCQTSQTLHDAAVMAVAAGRGAYVVRDVAGKSHALFELNIRGELMCIVAMNEDGSIAVIRNM